MKWKDQSTEKKVGLYLTVSIHLIVLIILLLCGINSLVTRESSFVLDFTKQEQIEKELKEIEFKENVSKELDEMLSTPNRSKIRNVAVDASSALKDDRYSNPKEIYDEAKELQRKLDAAKKEALSQEAKSEETVDLNNVKPQKEENKATTYKGPSVISYSLDGRKANYLPVPAYKGYGSGDVYVQILVNRSGRVIAAEVISEISSTDNSLRGYAIEAAKRSRFSASTKVPERQKGEIVYRFIGQ